MSIKAERVKSVRTALTAIFFLQGALGTVMIPRVPELIEQIDVNFTAWGAILGFSGLGALVGLMYANRYIVRFVGALAGKALPAAGFQFHLGSKASSSTGYIYTELSKGAAQSEIQKVDIKASGAGQFTLSLVKGGTTYTTTALNYGSSAAAVRYALNAALGSVGSVEVASSSATAPTVPDEP